MGYKGRRRIYSSIKGENAKEGDEEMQTNPRRNDWKPVLVNLDKGVWATIKETAHKEDRSASGLARLFMREGLERYLARTGRNDQTA